MLFAPVKFAIHSAGGILGVKTEGLRGGLKPGVFIVYTNPQKLNEPHVQRLRQDAGRWLKDLRESKRLTQRDLAVRVGAEYYTFISQLENGRGRIPPDRYAEWAKALDVPVRPFVKKMMSFYDPVTFALLFDGEQSED